MFASLLAPDNVSVTKNTATVKDTDGGHILAMLAENKLVPVRLELLEPTLESLYIEVAK